MKISFKTDGGFGFFPGLNKPLEIQTDDLPEDEAAHLKNLIDKVHIPSRSVAPSNLSKGADQKKHTIKIETGSKVFTIYLSDAEGDPSAQELLAFFKQKRNKL